MSAGNGNPDGNYSVRVCSGRHNGAEIALTAGAYVVGTGAEADIVLTDEGIVANHVELRFDGQYCRIWSLDGGIRVDDRPINPGGKIVVKLPAEFLAGAVHLRLAPPMVARAKKPLWRSRLYAALGIGVFAGGGLILVQSLPAFGTPLLAGGAVAAAVPAGAPAAVDARAPVPAAPIPPGDQAGGGTAAAATALAARLSAAGLGTAISLQAGGDMIEASGTIPPDMRGAWTAAQMWFDTTYKGGIALLNKVRVEAGAAAPQLAIQAIWAGAGPYVIGGDGDKYGEGAILPGGWRIESIAPRQVIVSRRGQRVSLTP